MSDKEIEQCFEQVEEELLETVFDIAEGEMQDIMRQQWGDFKDAIRARIKERHSKVTKE